MPEPKKPSEEPGEKVLTTTVPAAAGDAVAKPADKVTGTSKPAELDDPRPNSELWEMKQQRALADATKPIEPAAEAILSQDPDKVKARSAILEAYTKVARGGTDPDTHGELRARYKRVDDKFVDAAADMLRSREGNVRKAGDDKPSHLVVWIKKYLADRNGEVRKVLLQRQQVGARLTNRLGEREDRRQKTADDTKRWEQAFARWSAPEKEIAALIASYEGRIDQLNADINTGNNRDQAIFSFWFEVAPIHLQLRAEPVNDDNAPGVKRIRDALEGFDEDLLVNFQSGKSRDDGSVYLIDPPELEAQRLNVLKRWKEAAAKQAAAEADYATRPDAAADLKPRYDKLKGDAWVKGTSGILAKPKP